MAKHRKPSNLAAARERMYRDLIVESAERVFADHGFEKAAMQDIAGETGISLKTLYATFRGKEEIYREIAVRRAREFLEHASRSVSGEGSLIDRMARGVRAYVDFLLTHRNYFRIQLREGRSWGLDPSDESRSEWRSGLEVQASLLRAGIAEGVFHDGDSELMAATAIAIMQVQLAGLVERSKGQPDAEAITKEIVLALARYLCKPEGLAEARRAVSA